jgi:ATP synthase subunit 6
MVTNPLEQFQLINIFSLNFFDLFVLNFTNALFFLLLSIICFMLFNDLLQKELIKSNKTQLIIENIFNFLLAMVLENIGVNGQKYFTFVFSLFVFLLISNVFGMIPYSFTTTSHIIVTLFLSTGVFISIGIIGVRKHKIKFLGLFLPAGAPLALFPILIGIETMSYLIRIISLSVRLFANMMSGHILLKVLLGFA